MGKGLYLLRQLKKKLEEKKKKKKQSAKIKVTNVRKIIKVVSLVKTFNFK